MKTKKNVSGLGQLKVDRGPEKIRKAHLREIDCAVALAKQSPPDKWISKLWRRVLSRDRKPVGQQTSAQRLRP